MAEQLLDTIRDKVDGPIDFEGQRLAEQISTNSLAIIGLVAFFVGYFTQNILYTLWTMGGGAVLVFLAVVPPWPFYNKNPLDWLPSQDEMAGLSIAFTGGGQT